MPEAGVVILVAVRAVRAGRVEPGDAGHIGGGVSGGPGERRVLQVGVDEVGPRKVGASEVGTVEIVVGEVGVGQVGILETCVLDGGTGEDGTGEVVAGELRLVTMAPERSIPGMLSPDSAARRRFGRLR